MNLLAKRRELRRLLVADMYKKGVKVTRLSYRPNNPYPVSAEVLFKVIYKSQYNRKISKDSIDKLEKYFND